MTTPSRLNQLRATIADAAERLSLAEARARARSGPPKPGDTYVFDLPDEVAIEWLVVREHVDDATLLLLVPADDFPLAGSADVRIAEEFNDGDPLTVRCGEGLWLSSRFCQQGQHADFIPTEALTPVRKMLAGLARGRVEPSDESSQVDCDPEYLDWLDLVAKARGWLRRRADELELGAVIRFAELPQGAPSELAVEAPYALAAESGGGLLNKLGAAVDKAVGCVRYHEIDLASGKLVFQIDDSGARGVWLSPGGAEPPKLVGRNALGEACEATWQPSPQGGLQRSSPVFPWLGGRLDVTITKRPPQTLAIQR